MYNSRHASSHQLLKLMMIHYTFFDKILLLLFMYIVIPYALAGHCATTWHYISVDLANDRKVNTDDTHI